AAVSHEAREARARERAVLAVMIEARARRNRQPPGDVHIVLHEDTRHRERVAKAREIDGAKTLALDRDPADERVPRDRATQGHLAKLGVAELALGHLAEQMTQVLMRDRRPRAQ